MIFYRFDEIPKDECSSIWNNNNEVIGKEKGVSVYEVHKNINGNKYLVTGDLLDETGTNGEPLIKNVKILKKL